MYNDDCTTLNSHISSIFEEKLTKLTFYELQDVLEWDNTKTTPFTVASCKRIVEIKFVIGHRGKSHHGNNFVLKYSTSSDLLVIYDC